MSVKIYQLGRDKSFGRKYTRFYDKITLYFENKDICSAQNYCGPNGPLYKTDYNEIKFYLIRQLIIKSSELSTPTNYQCTMCDGLQY